MYFCLIRCRSPNFPQGFFNRSGTSPSPPQRLPWPPCLALFVTTDRHHRERQWLEESSKHYPHTDRHCCFNIWCLTILFFFLPPIPIKNSINFFGVGLCTWFSLQHQAFSKLGPFSAPPHMDLYFCKAWGLRLCLIFGSWWRKTLWDYFSYTMIRGVPYILT